VNHLDGEWAIDLTLTPNGAAQWDRLAEQQFHAIVGVVINGRVVSAPITQPTQSSFTSFDGRLQISGGFTEHQAEVIASEL
jgi:preprotein translocase subunit SecD